jgi:hypothetical protein
MISFMISSETPHKKALPVIHAEETISEEPLLFLAQR